VLLGQTPTGGMYIRADICRCAARARARRGPWAPVDAPARVSTHPTRWAVDVARSEYRV